MRKTKQNGAKVGNADQSGRLADLTPAPYNPRKIGRPEREGLKRSLERFGDLGCVVVNRRTGRVFAGNQRRSVLAELSVDQIVWGQPYDTARGTERDGWATAPDGSRFRIREVDWSEQDEQLACLAANHLGLQGAFVQDRLAAVLSELAQSRGEDLEALRLTALVEKLAEATTPPEVEFAEELLLEQNYIVLTFSNPFDWAVCQDVFGLKPAKDLKPRKSQPVGVGRVIPGAPWLERLAAGGTSK